MASSFLRTERPGFRSWTEDDLGVHIRSLHWRRGFAAEAASAAIGHGFGMLLHPSYMLMPRPQGSGGA